jgi:hypothetical protein
MKHDLELQSLIGSLEQISLKPDIREGLETLVREIQALNDSYQKEILRINSDERLTEIGKREQKQEESTNLMFELERYEDPYAEHLEQAERQLLDGGDRQTEKSGTDRLLDYLRQSEIRRMYGVEKMDVLEIEAHSSDSLFIDSILTSPKKLLPQEHINKLVMQKAQKENPELGVEIEQLHFADNAVKGILKTLTANVESNGWRDPENPLNKELETPDDEVKELAEG